MFFLSKRRETIRTNYSAQAPILIVPDGISSCRVQDKTEMMQNTQYTLPGYGITEEEPRSQDTRLIIQDTR